MWSSHSNRTGRAIGLTSQSLFSRKDVSDAVRSACPSKPNVSGQDIIKVLGNWRFKKVDQTGDHVKRRYVDLSTGEKRTVIVPLHDELDTETLKGIAEQAGADDFQKFLDEMDKMI